MCFESSQGLKRYNMKQFFAFWWPAWPAAWTCTQIQGEFPSRSIRRGRRTWKTFHRSTPNISEGCGLAQLERMPLATDLKAEKSAVWSQRKNYKSLPFIVAMFPCSASRSVDSRKSRPSRSNIQDKRSKGSTTVKMETICFGCEPSQVHLKRMTYEP